MKRMLLLLILPLIVLSVPMSARGDTQPAPDQAAAQTASDKYVASDMGIQKVQVAITRIHMHVDVAKDIGRHPTQVALMIVKPVQVALVMIGKPLNVAIRIVGKPLNVALQMFDKPRTKVALIFEI